MTKQTTLWIILLFFSLNLFSQTKIDFNKEAITEIMYQHTGDELPGMAVGIVKDGEIVYEHYIGYANLNHEVKVDQQTRFNIASNAKQYTALCILKLIEEGKLKLEDDFRTYLPDLYPNIEEPITISHLLNHRSGIRDYCDLIALTSKTWWKQFIDNGDVIEMLKAQQDLNFKPGTDYVYSNSNYTVLTEVIKKVSGKDFGEFALEVFEELDMPNTAFLTHYMAVVPHKARPYGNWNGWKDEPVITEVHGDGALYTTLADQLKWEQILQDNNGEYLSSELILQSQAPIENSQDKSYGYGLMFDQFQDLEYRYHDGVTGAYRATFLRFPIHNMSIVVMSNSRSVPANYAAWQIAFLLLELERETKTYPANPDKVEKLKQTQELLGVYKGEEGSFIRITEKEGSLYREIYQRDPVKLIPEEGGLFEYETIKGLKMNFSQIGKDDQQFTLYMSTQRPSTYKKVSDFPLSDYNKQELNTSFINDETDTEIVIKYLENDTFSITKNGRERKANMILEDYLRMNGYEITVLRDKDNQVIGLSVNNARLRNIRFRKS
ncbi:MAG: serine hydrolase domain-containing protein [Bacteroidota bacterium]